MARQARHRRRNSLRGLALRWDGQRMRQNVQRRRRVRSEKTSSAPTLEADGREQQREHETARDDHEQAREQMHIPPADPLHDGHAARRDETWKRSDAGDEDSLTQWRLA